MPIPYEALGRTEQKSRTRTALVAAAQDLLTQGVTPTLERVASQSGISRTTAYRYFPTQEALLAASMPTVGHGPRIDGSLSVRDRVGVVLNHQCTLIDTHETALRAALRVSLDDEKRRAGTTSERPALRTGRALGWLVDALTPLMQEQAPWPPSRIEGLAVAIRATCGIEAFVWLVDVAAVPRAEALSVMASNAFAVYDAATRES